MIHNALIFLAKQVNEHLNTGLIGTSDILEIGSLKQSDGSPSFDSLGMTLVAIDRETTISSGYDLKGVTQDAVIRQKRPLCLNLKVLVSTNFEDNYDDALKHLSNVISFFHTNNVFTHENSPTLDQNIEKLIIEINPNDTDDMYHIWSMAGISYLPSIIYRVRMIALSSLVEEELPPIKEIQSV